MWKCLLLFLWLPCIASAQKGSGYYTDILRDQNGAPIAGATISIKSTKQGTTTDKNGYFKIFVTEGNVLHITSVGYIGDDIKITADMLCIHAPVNYSAVTPVLSDDYVTLIQTKQDVNKNIHTDSIYTTPARTLQLTTSYYPEWPVKEINIHNNQFQVYQAYRNQLTISGSFNTAVEIKMLTKPRRYKPNIRKAVRRMARWFGVALKRVRRLASVHLFSHCNTMLAVTIMM